MKKNLPYFSLVLLFLLLDQASKIVVAGRIPLHSSLTVIPGFFNLSHIHNKGAIFGAFAHTQSSYVYLLLRIASLTALGLVVFYFFKTPPSDKGVKVALSLILAGALGNQVDRAWRGYVIDFLDFYIQKWHWPFFNIADSCITIGAFLLLFQLLRRKSSCSQS